MFGGVRRGEEQRIRSFPLNSGFPRSISAMMQPTDHMSTAQRRGGEEEKGRRQRGFSAGAEQSHVQPSLINGPFSPL